jgi:hypothetical protein
MPDQGQDARSAATTAPRREVEVTPGGATDKCPLCGIWRQNAGWMKLTCGTHLRKPGCFVAPEEDE